MTAILQTAVRLIPPYVLFLAGFGAVIAYGLTRLYAMLQDAGLGQ